MSVNYAKLASRCQQLMGTEGSAFGLMSYLREEHAPGIRRDELVSKTLPLDQALKRFFAVTSLKDNPKGLYVFKEYFMAYLKKVGVKVEHASEFEDESGANDPTNAFRRTLREKKRELSSLRRRLAVAGWEFKSLVPMDHTIEAKFTKVFANKNARISVYVAYMRDGAWKAVASTGVFKPIEKDKHITERDGELWPAFKAAVEGVKKKFLVSASIEEAFIKGLKPSQITDRRQIAKFAKYLNSRGYHQVKIKQVGKKRIRPEDRRGQKTLTFYEKGYEKAKIRTYVEIFYGTARPTYVVRSFTAKAHETSKPRAIPVTDDGYKNAMTVITNTIMHVAEKHGKAVTNKETAAMTTDRAKKNLVALQREPETAAHDQRDFDRISNRLHDAIKEQFGLNIGKGDLANMIREKIDAKDYLMKHVEPDMQELIDDAQAALENADAKRGEKASVEEASAKEKIIGKKHGLVVFKDLTMGKRDGQPFFVRTADGKYHSSVDAAANEGEMDGGSKGTKQLTKVQTDWLHEMVDECNNHDDRTSEDVASVETAADDAYLAYAKPVWDAFKKRGKGAGRPKVSKAEGQKVYISVVGAKMKPEAIANIIPDSVFRSAKYEKTTDKGAHIFACEIRGGRDASKMKSRQYDGDARNHVENENASDRAAANLAALKGKRDEKKPETATERTEEIALDPVSAIAGSIFAGLFVGSVVNEFLDHLRAKKHLEKNYGEWHRFRYEGKVGDIYYMLERPTTGKDGSSGGYVSFKTKTSQPKKYRMSWKNKETQFLSRAKEYARSVVQAMKQKAREKKQADAQAKRRRLALANIEALAAARKPAVKKPAKKAAKKKSPAKKPAGKRAGKKPDWSKASEKDPKPFEMIDDGGYLPPPKSAAPASKPKTAVRKKSGLPANKVPRSHTFTKEEGAVIRKVAKQAGGWIVQIQDRRGNNGQTSLNALTFGWNRSDAGDNQWSITKCPAIPLVGGLAEVDVATYSGTRMDRELEDHIILHIDGSGLHKITSTSADGRTLWKKS